jgi:integrase
MGPEATFGQVWADLLEVIASNGKWSERNTKVNVLRMRKHIEPSQLWEKPIRDIGPRHLHDVLAPIAKEAPDQAKKLRQLISKAITHAAANAIITASPVPLAASMMRNTMKAAAKKHHPALLEIEPLRQLVKAIMGMNGHASVRGALLLQAHVPQRASEVTNATWAEFDLDAGTWCIPRTRMKVKTEGRPDQVLMLPPPVAKWLRTLPRSESGLVFPGVGDRPMSENTLNQAMRRQLGMADKHTPHGWRSSLKTLASNAADTDGRPMFAPAWIEHVLDHLPGDAVEAAYMRQGDAKGAARVLAWWCDELGVLS